MLAEERHSASIRAFVRAGPSALRNGLSGALAGFRGAECPPNSGWVGALTYIAARDVRAIIQHPWITIHTSATNAVDAFWSSFENKTVAPLTSAPTHIAASYLAGSACSSTCHLVLRTAIYRRKETYSNVDPRHVVYICLRTGASIVLQMQLGALGFPPRTGPGALGFKLHLEARRAARHAANRRAQRAAEIVRAARCAAHARARGLTEPVRNALFRMKFVVYRSLFRRCARRERTSGQTPFRNARAARCPKELFSKSY